MVYSVGSVAAHVVDGAVSESGSAYVCSCSAEEACVSGAYELYGCVGVVAAEFCVKSVGDSAA